MEHFILVNGIDHSFLKEFGCPCTRCTSQRPAANTSVSLITLGDNNEILHHCLFDVGAGVIDSFMKSPYLYPDRARIDHLFITHWHTDHTRGLHRLCRSWWRTLKRRNEQQKPIPIWCRSGSAEWLKRKYVSDWNKFLNPTLSNETMQPGVKLDSVHFDTYNLRVTPITVSHCTADINPVNPEETLYSSASFIIDYKNKKIVFLWDIDNKNEWIVSPNSNEQKETVKLLSNADYFFIDCNTWKVEEVNGINTGHVSFMTVKRYIKALSPKGKIFLVHLSGHEDGNGNPGWGWDDRTWERNAQEIWRIEKLPGNVHVPRIRMKIHI